VRLRSAAVSTGRRIVVIDDDEGLVTSLVRLLRAEGHDVHSAGSRADGVEVVRRVGPDLVLLDYHLGADTGAEVVREIRTFDRLCQVLLVTGYAAEQPARKLLAELDIQGFHDKGDGPNKLLVQIDGALKHAKVLRALDRQRRQLRYLLDVGPEIARIQPVRELLDVALRGLGRLLHGGDGLIATSNSGLFVLGDPLETVSIHAGTGRWADVRSLSELAPDTVATVRCGFGLSAPSSNAGFVVVPLSTRNGDRGCMLVEASELPADAVEACELFARQVTQAIENVTLYERATVDPLTQLFNRAMGVQRLDEAMRLGTRTKTPTSVILLDIDRFKTINDTYGHAAGDLVLRAVSSLLKQTARTTDVTCRYGGEELLVVLPATDLAGAAALAERIRVRMSQAPFNVDGHSLAVTASFGVACAPLESSEVRASDLIAAADRALYRAKGSGRNVVCLEESPGGVTRAA